MSFLDEWDVLLGRARGGDRGALGQLVEATREDLERAASGLIGHSARRRIALEDLVSETLAAVVREIRALRATNYRGFRYWFASIARNHLCRRMRREEREPRANLGDDDILCEDSPAFWSGEELDHLRLALPGMPASQQLAIVLYEGLALPWATIGFVLERDYDATRLVHYRALVHVRNAVHFRRERAARGLVSDCDGPLDEDAELVMALGSREGNPLP
jgi:RNA polymerase sigma factor (sigma-70 family)